MSTAFPFPLHPMATAPRVALPHVLLVLHEWIVLGEVQRGWRLVSWRQDCDVPGWCMVDSHMRANPTAWVCVMPNADADVTETSTLPA